MERPIILKAHEVRGILDGRQTQLRRIVKEQHRLRMGDGLLKGTTAPNYLNEWGNWQLWVDNAKTMRCPFGQVGDRLWGREAFWPRSNGDVAYKADDCWIAVDEDGRQVPCSWKPSTNMSRQHSRILLEIVSVRVERLQDISEADARAEGCPYPAEWAGRYIDRDETAKTWFATEYNCANGKGSWDANPWVWCVTFRRVA